jgi:hypothetical protein
MPYQSNLPAVRAQMERARDAGLIAAAQVVINDEKRRLRGGFTSGLFVTGNILNSVTRTEPTDENGVRVIRVGTDVEYAPFWELGHVNAWSRKFERVETWVLALFSTASEQAAAFSRVFARFMASQRPASEAAD